MMILRKIIYDNQILLNIKISDRTAQLDITKIAHLNDSYIEADGIFAKLSLVGTDEMTFYPYDLKNTQIPTASIFDYQPNKTFITPVLVYSNYLDKPHPALQIKLWVDNKYTNVISNITSKQLNQVFSSGDHIISHNQSLLANSHGCLSGWTRSGGFVGDKKLFKNNSMQDLAAQLYPDTPTVGTKLLVKNSFTTPLWSNKNAQIETIKPTFPLFKINHVYANMLNTSMYSKRLHYLNSYDQKPLKTKLLPDTPLEMLLQQNPHALDLLAWSKYHYKLTHTYTKLLGLKNITIYDYRLINFLYLRSQLGSSDINIASMDGDMLVSHHLSFSS